MGKSSYFKLGVFVIGAIIIGVLGVIALGLGHIFETKTIVESYIDESVQGLDVGSPVKFRGVLAGKVDQITLTNVVYNTRRSYVLVRIAITSKIFQFPLDNPADQRFRHELERGFRFRLAAQGLTGAAYIEADYLKPEGAPPLEIDWNPRYPYIPSVPSRITQLSEAVERILRNIEQINIPQLTTSVGDSLKAMTKLVESANIEKIGSQANLLLTEVRQTNRQLGGLVGSPELKSALADTSAAASGVRQMIERAQGPVDQMLADLPRAAESLERMVKRLDSVTADLPETSAQLRQTLQRMNRLIATQQQGIAATVDNLQAVSSDMRELTESSRKYPSQVLFGAPPPPSKVMKR